MIQILQYDFSTQTQGGSLAGSILRRKDAIATIAIQPETEDDEINEVDEALFTRQNETNTL